MDPSDTETEKCRYCSEDIEDSEYEHEYFCKECAIWILLYGNVSDVETVIAQTTAMNVSIQTVAWVWLNIVMNMVIL